MRRQSHAGLGKLSLLPGLVPPLLAGKVQGHGDVAHQQHVVGRFAVELNERVLPGQSVLALRRHNGVSDPVEARHRNQFRLGMEGVIHMHVGHDLIAGFDQIVGAALSGNLGESEVAFRIDQSGIHRHPSHIDHLRVFRNLHRIGCADGSDLARGDHEHAVLNRAMRNREQLAALKHESFLLGRSCH